LNFKCTSEVKDSLIKFEQWTVETYKAGKLRSPIHLSGGDEEQLIAIFKEIKPNDWVFSNYRSHYHALLKGVPEEELKQWIMDNKSIHFMSKHYKIFTSAIVGGCLPIAVGTAMAIKEQLKPGHVWIFVGDMTAETGIFHECTKYARRHNLPITFIVADNGLSTDTPTQETWGIFDGGPNVYRYQFKRTYPHYGCGVFIDFGEEK
jgi:TPP-dependent pyruvate/acetoin dehydrogenase alpha subunit